MTKNPPTTKLLSWRRTSTSRSSRSPTRSHFRYQLRRMQQVTSLATQTFWLRHFGTRLVTIRVIQTLEIWTKMSNHSTHIKTSPATCQRGTAAVSQTLARSTWCWKEEMRTNSKITWSTTRSSSGSLRRPKANVRTLRHTQICFKIITYRLNMSGSMRRSTSSLIGLQVVQSLVALYMETNRMGGWIRRGLWISKILYRLRLGWTEDRRWRWPCTI